jgi:internalin A
MGSRRHWIFIAAWAVVLATAAVLFWDRLFPGSTAAPSRNTPSGTPAQRGTASTEVSVSPRASLHKAIIAKNPGYTGNGEFAEKDGKINIVVLSKAGVTDLTPLHGLALYALDISGNPVSDLTPIGGMPLHKLGLEGTKVTDLGPVRDMPLSDLYLNGTPVCDLSPLKGVPLNILNLLGTAVEDLSPLEGMPLKSLWLNGTRVKDLSPLRGCPLVSVTLEGTPVTDLSPLAGGRLERLHIGQSAVTDLTPIKGLPLTRLIFTPGRIKQGMEVARNMQSIREIGTTLDGRMPPEKFWPLCDQGKLEPGR